MRRVHGDGVWVPASAGTTELLAALRNALSTAR
jgi:hypothetical protein